MGGAMNEDGRGMEGKELVEREVPSLLRGWGRREADGRVQVAREGSKKTVFVNFKEMSKKMHRTMEHVMSYFNAELGVPCSLDPEGKLTFKGRFTPKQIESVVRKYMLAYVQCQMCKNYDSKLVKDSMTRLTFLECNRCGVREEGRRKEEEGDCLLYTSDAADDM
eukprot:753917-Hanusia_phi.AAC.5